MTEINPTLPRISQRPILAPFQPSSNSTHATASAHCPPAGDLYSHGSIWAKSFPPVILQL